MPRMTDTPWSCTATSILSSCRQLGLAATDTRYRVGKDQAGLQVGTLKLVPAFQTLYCALFYRGEEEKLVGSVANASSDDVTQR